MSLLPEVFVMHQRGFAEIVHACVYSAPLIIDYSAAMISGGGL